MRISAAESQVMAALWARGPVGFEDLVRDVAPAQNWGAATVKTLVTRLLKKKAIISRRVNGRAVYEPLVSRETYLTGESQGLLDRLFDGQLAPLVAHFAKHRTLSPDDVARLRRLLEDYERDHG